MSLFPEDEQYLIDHGFQYETSEWQGNIAVIIKNYELPSQYSQPKVDVLVLIPPGYPEGQMDMFWVFPAVRITTTGHYPAQADCMQEMLGRTWQRFSRHYAWRPGISSLASHLATVKNSLKKVA